RALEAAKKCDALYVEFYTNKMDTDVEKLSKLIGKNVIELKRSGLEEKSDKIINAARNKNVGVLIPGDALSATTHISLLLDARRKGIETRVVHGSSILTAVGEAGLQLYKFGRTVTLTYPEKGYSPAGAYDAMLENRKAGLHTLILLDIKSEKGRYMTAKEGLEILLEIEKRKRSGLMALKTRVVAACSLGGEGIIKYDSVENLLKDKSTGKPPAVLIFPGELHFMEKEFLESL
ncbi:MAG: diphthine synthase, partial [Candidatus Aenigmarchaeota archaeon]|nr:diphthine synthase [Candidatus Aenigmarchaeota archaeon]